MNRHSFFLTCILISFAIILSDCGTDPETDELTFTIRRATPEEIRDTPFPLDSNELWLTALVENNTDSTVYWPTNANNQLIYSYSGVWLDHDQEDRPRPHTFIADFTTIGLFSLLPGRRREFLMPLSSYPAADTMALYFHYFSDTLRDYEDLQVDVYFSSDTIFTIR